MVLQVWAWAAPGLGLCRLCQGGALPVGQGIPGHSPSAEEAAPPPEGPVDLRPQPTGRGRSEGAGLQLHILLVTRAM